MGIQLSVHETIEGVLCSFESGAISINDAVLGLAPILRARYVPRFKALLRIFLTDQTDIIDITSWRFVAVRALLQVLNELHLITPIKIQDQVLRVLRFPDDPARLNQFTKSLLKGNI